ncbi:FGGY-family carbohydrate kinase [Tropicimonas sp.]|uniref:FGGY-family carbohydrate kinase n=1 Tax=Tropicimonas sp. TaxID=2067044 RepID=UPI003A8BA6D4
MTRARHVAVIDIGKTNAKLALVDLDGPGEVSVVTTPNRVLAGPPYPHTDLDGLWDFITASLARMQRDFAVDAISVTTHGASAVLLDDAGAPAVPMPDYEYDGPDRLAAAYDAIRPDFAETGSPRLPLGLNLGAQLFWLLETRPDLRERVAHIVTYPQFWVGRLTGEYCTEGTSLGCHTDLWQPYTGQFSPLVGRLGLAEKMAPVRRANDPIGTLLPQVAASTGLAADTPVFCGIHDSNASLYPHLLAQEPPFSVLSTGTWVIAMAIGGVETALDPGRDTLINVNAFGDPVPSARFMGGREFGLLTRGAYATPTQRDIDTVLGRAIRLLPAVVAESGPFPGRQARWSVPPESLTAGQHGAAVSLYLAMMAETCLGMIGARGPVLTEGPFAGNPLFLDMLGAATGRPVLLPGGSATGTSIGAALLARGDTPDAIAPAVPHPPPGPERRAHLVRYAALWRASLANERD